VLTELLTHLEDVLFAGHSGVVVKMAELCLRSPDQQSEMMKILLVAFHAKDDPNACIPLFLTLTAYEAYLEHEQKRETDKDVPRRSVHVQGSLLVQALFKYENPRVVVRSLLGMETDDLMWLSCDVAGSHAVDAFLSSSTVKSVKKKKLIEKIRPQLVPLCKDKHGSRVMDALWRSSEVAVKESLAEELIAHEAELTEDFYGRIVMRNCNVAHYRRKQAVWQERAPNTLELFHDILDDVNAPSSKRIKCSNRAPDLPRKKKKKA
jgi:nucleolar protein 9